MSNTYHINRSQKCMFDKNKARHKIFEFQEQVKLGQINTWRQTSKMSFPVGIEGMTRKGHRKLSGVQKSSVFYKVFTTWRYIYSINKITH